MLRVALVLLLAAPAAASPRPRLVLAVSVDQMLAGYLDRPGYSAGLKRLAKEGAVFTDAHHAHIPTETAPGHAVILTGRHPGETGIVANDWWDRRAGRLVYNVDDPVYGTGPSLLEAYTVGDALKAASPSSRVVAVSVKDRGAVLMGGQRPDAVIWYDKKKGAFVSSRYYGAEPDWLQGFNAALRAPGAPLAEGTTEAFRRVIEDPAGDEMVLRLALEVLERYDLGADDAPDVLAVSFSATDYIGHRWGTDGPEMRAQLESLDLILGRLLEAVERRAGKERVLVALTADHAAMPTPEGREGRRLGARRLGWVELGARMEQTLQALHAAPGRKWVLSHDPPNVYLDRALAEERGLEWRAYLREAARALSSVDGLAAVHVADEVPAGAPYAAEWRRSYYPGRSGDLYALQERGVVFLGGGTGTTHGSPYEYDTHVPLVLMGEGVKRGRYREKAWVADLAPTLGRALGLDFKPAEGARARDEALR